MDRNSASLESVDSKAATMEEFSQKVIHFDKRIRSCSILDSRGNPLHVLVRDKLTSLVPKSENLKLFLHTAIGVGMDKVWNKQMGTTRHIVITRERVTLAIFPLADAKSILVSTEPSFPAGRLTKLGEFVDSLGLTL
jgi:hypothetical protein